MVKFHLYSNSVLTGQWKGKKTQRINIWNKSDDRLCM